MKNLLFSAICGLLIFGIESVEFDDCGSVLGSVTKVSISGCEAEAKVCILHRNTNVSVSIDFEPVNDATALKAIVHGAVLGLPIPFELPNPNGCVDSGVACPLKKDTNYVYTGILPILKGYPAVTYTLMWELKNEAGKDIVCAGFLVKIQ